MKLIIYIDVLLLWGGKANDDQIEDNSGFAMAGKHKHHSHPFSTVVLFCFLLLKNECF